MPGTAAGDPPLAKRCRRPGNGMAIASLILSVLGIGLGPVLQIPGVCLGHGSLIKTRNLKTRPTGRKLAKAGMIIGYAGLAVWLAAGYLVAQEFARSASCVVNLGAQKTMLLVYVAENGGMYPPVSPEPGRLMYSIEGRENLPGVYPEYMSDASACVCPTNSHKARGDTRAQFDDHSYYYLGYAMNTDEHAELLAKAYLDAVQRGEPLEGDIDADPGAYSPLNRHLYRLRERVEIEFMTEIFGPRGVMRGRVQAEIPVVIERMGNHWRKGGHVLFLDGHIEFIKYPGKFPMTERTIAALESMDRAKAP